MSYSSEEQIAETILAHNREDVGRADAKASILLSGAIAALTFGSALGRPPSSAVERWLIGGGVALWATGIILLALAVLPRLDGGAWCTGVSYFGDVRRTTRPGDLRRQIARSASDRLSWLLVQVHDTSGIVVTKYRCIRLSLVLFAAGGAATAIGWLF